jgi:hypothetical protein
MRTDKVIALEGEEEHTDVNGEKNTPQEKNLREKAKRRPLPRKPSPKKKEEDNYSAI